MAIDAFGLIGAFVGSVFSAATSVAFLGIILVWTVRPEVSGPGVAVVALRQTQTV